jgi:hypothetical protein
MADNVIKFPSDLDPNEVLEHSKNQFSELLIVGWDTNGALVVNGTVSVPEAVLLLELGKSIFIQEIFGEDYSMR